MNLLLQKARKKQIHRAKTALGMTPLMVFQQPAGPDEYEMESPDWHLRDVRAVTRLAA
jgi:hypothetical protein